MKNEIVIFFRKSRNSRNFSIERAFDATIPALPNNLPFPPVRKVVSTVSSGLIPRIKILLEVWRERGRVNHITGDINFAVLSLPRNNTVLTVLDCGFMNHPNKFARKLIYFFWLKWPVNHCKYITAISASTKADIIRYTNCNPEKIHVIPVVITSDFKTVDKVFNKAKPIILHIGTAPNKNLKNHIQALKGIPCTLYIIGQIQKEEQLMLDNSGVEYVNVFNLTNDEVREAYESCDIVLFASTLEGFGMPILEGQRVGRPVVTSNCSSMPEVAGSGACLVDPFSEESIRAGILSVINDSEYRERLVQNGFLNLERYTAENVANQYAELYKKMLAGSDL